MAVFAQGLQVGGVVVAVIPVDMVHIQLGVMQCHEPTSSTFVFLVLAIMELGDVQRL